MMEKKKRRSLHKILTMVCTFAMVIVFAGLIGKVDVNAEDYICKATVQVKDKETGNIIPDAKVIFTGYYSPYTPVEVTQNKDGTYNLPYDEWGMYYRYYATAEGYKDNRDSKGMGVSTGCIENPTITLSAISLEKFPPEERLQESITKAEEEINDYLDKSKYEKDEVAKIESIINEYLMRVEKEIEVDTEETEDSANQKIESLNKIVEDTKKKLDGIVTSQSKMNEQFADFVSFTKEGKEPVFLGRTGTEYGKFRMTVGLFDKGGLFNVTHDENTPVTWKATEKQFSISGGSSDYDVPYINSVDTFGPIGAFLCDKALPPDTSFRATTIPASVTFMYDGKQVTVTFDLVVEPLKIEGIEYNGPTSVELTRDEDGYFNIVVEKGTKENQYSLTVKSNDSNYKQDVTIESLTPSIADLNKKDTIIPKKTGTARFKATSENCDDYEFEITFVLSKKEQQEIAEAEAVDELIAALGDITLAKESEVEKAKEAYDKLSENAKKKVSKRDVLTAAEKKIVTLKAQESEKKAQESEKKAQESEKKAQESEKQAQDAATKAQESEKKAQEAETKAQESEKKAQDAETKAQEAEKKATALQEQAIKQQLTKITLKATAGKKKVKLTWKKNAKATGYVIYRATKNNGTYKKIKVIKTWKTSSFTDKKLKSGKKYYYKIRAYKGSTNGTLSNAKSVKVK